MGPAEHILHKVMSVVLGAVLLCGGCGGADPGDDGGIAWEDPIENQPAWDGGQDFPRGNDPYAGPPTGLAAPSVDTLPDTVCSATVAVRGQTMPGAHVMVSGGAAAGGATAIADAATGRFCVEVELRPQQVNVLEIRVANSSGQTSDAVIRTVTQGGSNCGPTTPGGGGLSPNNVALGAAVSGSSAPVQGTAEAVVDGQLTTVAVWSGGVIYWPWGDYNGWIKIALNRSYPVEKIIIHWRDSATSATRHYGYTYQLLYNAQPGSDPGTPDPANNRWKVLPRSGGLGGTESISLPRGLPPIGAPQVGDTLPQVQFVALWLQQDGAYNFFGYTETFAIAEIEVISPLGSAGNSNGSSASASDSSC